MSHHLSGPNLRSPEGDARLDLTDLFAFASPRPGRTVLIMNVNPVAPSGGQAFHPQAVYRIDIDTDGDRRADIAYSFTFSEPEPGSGSGSGSGSESAGGAQTMTVRRTTGEGARGHEATGEVLVSRAPVGFTREPAVVEAGPYRVSAGLRSDPFFADLDGIVKDFQWTGVDWGADKNVFGIVLEGPDEAFGEGPEIGVWARVSVRKDGRLVSVDRGAHPSLTAYFNEEDVKEAYNAGEPVDDWENYREPWTAKLQHFGGYTTDAAQAQLRIVLPDILRYDRSRPAGYPNGRTLTDDVTSARLTMLTDGRVSGDHIGPHTDLLAEFPYLGHPH
ncbi:DUF4331 family protein [Kitasatospora sp. NPDC058444]|uniref:DUF4331 family protein n=1 Tax=Kitasatospora sp. NPDC058444 TaxID=3346504 RepID=UPI0036572149